ncbi:hypothetical protein BC832DRAFT_526773, partial [Gaertneriomyces semiglobifer]
GNGKYTYPNGSVYVGSFKDGRFHGQGTIHFPGGGKYDALWENGVVKEGKYTFKDGLEFSPQNWDYCTDSDRRYYSERVNGFQPGDPQLSNDPAGPPAIPPDTFDCGDGYYDPRDEVVYNYLGQKIRIPDEEEKEWIVR